MQPPTWLVKVDAVEPTGCRYVHIQSVLAAVNPAAPAVPVRHRLAHPPQ